VRGVAEHLGERSEPHTRMLGDVEIFTFSSHQVVFSEHLVFFSSLSNPLHIGDQENLSIKYTPYLT